MAEEKNFENKVKEFLRENGAWYIKYWAGSKFTKKGIPDILSSVNGHFVAIETKAPEGGPTKLQLYTIRKIRESGGFAFVLYPSGFDWFKDFIYKLKREEYNMEMEVIIK